MDGRRRRRARRDRRLHGGRARLARRPALAARRGGAGDDARRLADARPRADPEGRRRPPTSRRCARSRRPASRGTRARTTGSTSTSAGGGRMPIVNISGGTEVGACFLSSTLIEPIKPVSLGVPGARRGDGRLLDAEGRLAARRGRRARLHASLARDDARLLGRRRALPRDLLAPLPGRLDARRLGVGRRGRLLVPARPLRRHAQHRRQADRAGRARVGRARRTRGRRGGRDRRAARGEGRGRPGSSVALEAGRRAATLDGDRRPSPPRSARRSRPSASCSSSALPKTRSAKIVRRAVRAAALGEDPGDLSSLENPEALEEIANAV